MLQIPRAWTMDTKHYYEYIIHLFICIMFKILLSLFVRQPVEELSVDIEVLCWNRLDLCTKWKMSKLRHWYYWFIYGNDHFKIYLVHFLTFSSRKRKPTILSNNGGTRSMLKIDLILDLHSVYLTEFDRIIK